MEYILNFNLKELWNLMIQNREWLFSGIGLVILSKIYKSIHNYFTSDIKHQTVKELLNTVKQDGIRNDCYLAKALRIDEIIDQNFPEYSDYLLIQYGSSVDENNISPNDYDFIVLLLGHPSDNQKMIHHLGNYPIIEEELDKKTRVDIVFRDYTSFLFAACAGMPYENSIIVNSKLLHGHSGYYEWLKNITKNILIDRDFLVRRFKEKIQNENEIYEVEKKYGSHKYDLIRAGYYYTTSILQKNKIEKLDKVLIQDSVVELAKVYSLSEDITDSMIKVKYEKLVKLLKRGTYLDDQIFSEDIDEILDYALNGVDKS